jgi:hypothetical protein
MVRRGALIETALNGVESYIKCGSEDQVHRTRELLSLKDRVDFDLSGNGKCSDGFSDIRSFSGRYESDDGNDDAAAATGTAHATAANDGDKEEVNKLLIPYGCILPLRKGGWGAAILFEEAVQLKKALGMVEHMISSLALENGNLDNHELSFWNRGRRSHRDPC